MTSIPIFILLQSEGSVVALMTGTERGDSMIKVLFDKRSHVDGVCFDMDRIFVFGVPTPFFRVRRKYVGLPFLRKIERR